ncbi:MAG: TetR/AcrR family transcriptional regulator, partial [Clostridia bacterium]|nr:TetR/AcrR family transcriptional regulator [Clostridia bacterium]
MKNPKVDRRIRKTRDTLKRTLAELVREKDLRDITVRDITEKADLNRGTFYL